MLIYSFLYISISVVAVLVLSAHFPKYESFVRYLFVFLLFDAYLWLSVRKSFASWHSVLRQAITVVYWIPFTALLLLIIYGNFKPFPEWSTWLKTWPYSLLLVLIISKSFPILACLLSDFIWLVKFTYSRLQPDKKVIPHASRSIRPLIKGGWLTGTLVFFILLAAVSYTHLTLPTNREV